MSDSHVIRLVVQLYEIKTKRDGGVRIVLDAGIDSLDGIKRLVELNAAGDINLALAVVPYSEGKFNNQAPEISETGEIKI